MKRGLLLFAHGARDPAWARPFEAIARRVRERNSGSNSTRVLPKSATAVAWPSQVTVGAPGGRARGSWSGWVAAGLTVLL